jgi:hypothetical protein
MNEYQINSFGHAHFVIEKKGKTTPIDCYGVIKAVEKKYILFEDNDKFPYLVEKAKFQFTAEQFKQP